MGGLELVYVFAALLALGGAVFAIRRAASKSLEAGPKRAQLPAKTRAASPELEPSEKESGESDDAAEAVPDDEDEDRDSEDDAEQLRAGLAKTRGGFVAKLGRIFSKKKIDDDVVGELEEVLMTADIGPRAANKLLESVRSELSRSDLEDTSAVWQALRQQSLDILKVDSEPLDYSSHKPFVMLTIGVNGVGKTTTIGKVASKLRASGKKVLLAAGDTFRAAAVEQLEVWGERSGCPVVKGKDQGDPSSVIFDAIKRGQDEGYDVVIADTAGRLHTKVDLMDELKKVRRVVDKAMPGAPHETWLVLDSTTGQNAIHQSKTFKEAMDITGIVLTKLDGTAKGGVILGIVDELKVPVRFIGIGEKIDDLRTFDANRFVDALFDGDP